MKTWLWCVFCLAGFAQELTLKQIMEDPYWMGELPSAITFSLDGQTVYFQVPQPIPNLPKWKAYEINSQSLRDAEPRDMPNIMRNDILRHGNVQALEINGDLWVSQNGAYPSPKLVDSSFLQLVRFLKDETLVYKKNDQLYSIDLTTGQSIQLTNLKLADEPEEKETWYSREEKTMLDYVADLHKSDDLRKERSEERRQIGPLTKAKPIYLGDGYDVAGVFGQEGRFPLDISPDSQYIAVVLEPDQEGQQTEYADFINKEVAVRALKARPKVGHATPTWKLAFADRKSGDIRWLDIKDLPDIERDPLAEIKDGLSEADKKYLPKASKGPRPVMFLPGGFQPEGNRYLVTAYSRDYKDRWIFLVNPKTLETELINHHYDEAWVPHILRGLNVAEFRTGAAFWARDGKSVAFLSDHEGYQHLYLYNLKKKKLKALTSGNFEVHSPEESQDGKHWYFHATPDHPGTVHYYKMPIQGGKLKALTSGQGHQLVKRAPNGDAMAGLFSTTNTPPVLMVNNGGTWKEAYDGRSKAFKAINWSAPEVISYPNRDGKPVYARLYRPEKSNGAGVIFVHGAGYLQNAHKGWSGYFREYMFHNLLQREGYTVLDPDYQASAGYGRDWRTAIYRHMGGKDLNDIVDGAAYLAKQPGVNEKKLGVYGGSYGGFITLMAMFTSPDTFQSGAALRPVTDWAYYNHWYTSRILNTPFDDPQAYRQSSPIYFADGLKGHLLIAHGMVDSNVQYQDSVRLAQKLIELRKHNWELSSYPVEPHGFRTPTGWYDEYRRIYELFAKTLL